MSRAHHAVLNQVYRTAPRKVGLLLIATVLLCTFNVNAEQAVSDKEEKSVAQAVEREPLAYSGWAAIKRNSLDESAAEDDWIYMKEINILDNGQIVKILDEGKETGYSVQLAVLTYERTSTTVLKFGLIEDSSGKTKTYIWGEPGAKRLGMNLRWMQTGFTRQDGAGTE